MTAWQPVAERALLARFDEDDIGVANRRARAVRGAVAGLAGVEDAIVGARSVLVVLAHGAPAPPELERALDARMEPAEIDTPVHTLRVAYDGDDLEQLARERGLDVEDVVAIHSAGEYVVGFLGFAPGFAYLLGLDERIHAPRLATPRARVPARSVAIGGPFTAVYPRPTPGGWRLIGRLVDDVELFEPSRARAATLAPGDRVRFVAA